MSGTPKKDLDAWFEAEVIPLAPMLTRFLRDNWRNQSEVPDLRQEVFARLYEAAHREIPTLVKPFLFQMARNLMIDHLRRKRVLAIDAITDLEMLNVPTEETSPEQNVAAREELKLFRAALEAVPPRQREAIMLRKIDGLSQRETAYHMGVSEGAIERLLTLGLRNLAEALLDTEIPTGRHGLAVMFPNRTKFE